jgi:hypothetical protein
MVSLAQFFEEIQLLIFAIGKYLSLGIRLCLDPILALSTAAFDNPSGLNISPISRCFSENLNLY